MKAKAPAAVCHSRRERFPVSAGQPKLTFCCHNRTRNREIIAVKDASGQRTSGIPEALDAAEEKIGGEASRLLGSAVVALEHSQPKL